MVLPLASVHLSRRYFTKICVQSNVVFVWGLGCEVRKRKMFSEIEVSLLSRGRVMGTGLGLRQGGLKSLNCTLLSGTVLGNLPSLF